MPNYRQISIDYFYFWYSLTNINVIMNNLMLVFKFIFLMLCFLCYYLSFVSLLYFFSYQLLLSFSLYFINNSTFCHQINIEYKEIFLPPTSSNQYSNMSTLYIFFFVRRLIHPFSLRNLVPLVLISLYKVNRMFSSDFLLKVCIIE